MLGGHTTGPESTFIVVRNDEASTVIAVGSPAIFSMDGTRDGKDVELPSSSSALLATGFFAGIATREIAAGASGVLRTYGIVPSLTILRQTRAASTDSWASFLAVASGDALIVNTVVNLMARHTAGIATHLLPYCVALASLASATTIASTTSVTFLTSTGTMKAFLRSM